MSSFGFRQPQFSEESAYLPIWLQNPQLEARSSDSAREAQSPSSSGPELKILSIPRDSVGCENVAIGSSGEDDGRYKDCYLFLSGEGNSESNVSPSPENLLHFSLRISLDDDSANIQSQILYSSNLAGKSNNLPFQHQIETLSRWDEKACQLEMNNNARGVTCPPLSSSPAIGRSESIQLLSNMQDRGMQGEENSNVLPAIMENHSPLSAKTDSHCEGKSFAPNQDEDTDINDAVELSIAASEALVIHELMKADSNSEGLEMGSILEAALRVKQARLEYLDGGCRYEEVDEADFLSDMDDSVMGDAFLDVGLSLSGSYVSGSDVSRVKDTPLGGNDDDHVNGSELPKNQPVENVGGSAWCSSSCNMASHANRSLDQQEDISLKQTQGANSNGGEKKVTRKGIAKYFVEEASFLSESADAAVNEISCVHKKDNGPSLASQCSINFNGLGDNAHKVVLPSQEISSAYVSASDPLCSVVPCSIPGEDTVSPVNENQTNAEVEAPNCFGHKSILGENGSVESSHQSLYIDDQAVSTAGCEDYPPLIRRKLGTLKAYRKISVDTNRISDGDRDLYHGDLSSKMINQLLVSAQNTCLLDSSCKELDGLNPIKECTVDMDEDQVQDSLLHRNASGDMENVKVSCHEPGEEEALLCAQSSVQRSPIILNRRTRHRLELTDNKVPAARCLEQDLPEDTTMKIPQSGTLQNVQSENGLSCTTNPVRKRVHFSVEIQHDQGKDLLQKSKASSRDLTVGDNKRVKVSKPRSGSQGHYMKKCLLGHKQDFKSLIFYRLEFLITGFSCARERELGEIIQQFGGIVLSDIPSHRNSSCRGVTRSYTRPVPTVICSRKLQTAKFLYGCAVNASILKAKWITDSIAAGAIAPAERYLVLPNQADTRPARMVSMNQNNRHRIFDRVGIMLHGKPSFCRKLSLIIKHGGGEVFKTLQRLHWSLDTGKLTRGVIVAEDQSRALRHLQHCAAEQKIALMPASWIVKSLHLGKLLPLQHKEDDVQEIEASPNSLDWSQEI